MKLTNSLAVTMAAAAMLVLSVPCSSFSEMKGMAMQHHEGHGQMMGMGQMDGMGDMMGNCIKQAEKIGLTDDQLAKMKPMHSEMQKKQARFMADLKIAEIDFKEIMDVKDFDLELAKSAVKKIAEIHTAHQLEMLNAMKEMRTLLTAEQFKKMKKEMMMSKDEKRPAKKMMRKHKSNRTAQESKP